MVKHLTKPEKELKMHHYSWKYGSKHGTIDAESIKQAWDIVINSLTSDDLSDDFTIIVRPL